MALLIKVLTSIVRRVITGAAVSILAVLVARGFFSIELRDEVMRWLNGSAVDWIVALILSAIGAGLTWIDKYRTELRAAAARSLPAGATKEEVERHVRINSLGQSWVARLLAGGK